MKCCFCKSEKAVHLDPSLPLCLTCADLQDFIREWRETRESHNLSLDEYAKDMMRFYSPHSSPSATVH